MKLLIISDSHLHNEWCLLKKDYDYIIHAGDHMMSREWIITNTDYYVDGNNDWGNHYEEKFIIEGINFWLVHGDEYHLKNRNNFSTKLLETAKAKNANVVIYGHTHIPSIKKVDEIIFINPGSISKPRFPKTKKTYCVLEIENKKISSIAIKEFIL